MLGPLHTYVSIPGRGSILPLERLQSPNSSRRGGGGCRMGFPTEKQLGQCYLNIEIFLLEIDIVMSFVSYVDIVQRFKDIRRY
jgi:hypothetical protein